ncbi:LysR family transcriptional regulator [Janibacter cremeus]|uniref:DNA-binding transcriptional LysR family regulator n=1 Tax=Janibacter cremeus TaxID=1285192 RepID=A0A852VTK7_9MICO|nr:LysR family transcriptional regulator [Janibacter cremeus]NYF99329.1 DNA-binding transcriptional LysR family regulator [Janibacter cremeus]
MAATDLSLRHLAALVAIHEEGSYRRAAARLGFSQAAVTSQIATLEKTLGATVFHRPGGPRPVVLTAVGLEVLDVARDLLATADLLDLRIASLRDGTWGRLAIGTFQSVSARLLPAVLGELRQDSPAVEVTVLESNDNDVLIRALRSARLDVSFLVGPVDAPGLTVREVVRDTFVAVVRAGDPAQEALSIRDLGDRPLIGHDQCACHELVERGFSAAGIQPAFAFRSNDNAAVQAMVRAGIGTAVMPALSVDPQDPGVRLLPIAPALPARSILLAHVAERPPPTAIEFVDRTLAAAAGLEL